MEPNRDMQNKIIEIRMLEEQIGQMEEQMRIVDREILEIQSLILSLDEIKGTKNKEVIVPLGKDIFVKSLIAKDNEFLVNIGSKTIVKKNAEETKKLLEEKKEKLYDDMKEFGWDLEKYERLGIFRFLEYTPEQIKRVLVEGVNKVKKHERPRKANQKGQVVERAMPIHISNVALVKKK